MSFTQSKVVIKYMKEKQTSKISTEMNTHQEIISSLKQVKWDYDETSKTGLGYRRGGGEAYNPSSTHITNYLIRGVKKLLQNIHSGEDFKAS